MSKKNRDNSVSNSRSSSFEITNIRKRIDRRGDPRPTLGTFAYYSGEDPPKLEFFP